ncbi:MAG: hypothetical protein SCK70_05270 [bacterium]|nr:hypothetical protein [bacterium]
MQIEKDSGQIMFPQAHLYRYEAVLSSELEQSPQANLCWYDGRGKAEDLIYAFIKAISYNLFQFFKAVAMPSTHQSWQIKTVRRKLINLPGNILGNSRHRRVKLALRHYLKYLLSLIQKKLQEFLWFVANGFRHCKLEFA